MSTTADLVIALKKELKSAQMTYASLAQALGMAESSVKRMLAKGDMPLSRIDAICRVLRLDFAGGIGAVKSFVDAVNLYVTEQEPWALAKDESNAERLSTVLYTICESLRAIAVLYHPVMPKATASLWEQLGADLALGSIGEQRVQDAGVWGLLPAGATVTKGAILFPRLEDPAE